MPTNTKNHHQSTSQKKSYSSPILTHFGTIGELTSGGTGAQTEPVMNMISTMHP